MVPRASANHEAMAQLGDMISAFWDDAGEALLDGRISAEDFVEGLGGLAVMAYRLGLRTAVRVIEGRVHDGGGLTRG